MGTDSEETLPLSEILFRAIDKKLCDMNIMVPCTVEKYDKTLNRVEVTPAFKKKYKSETEPVDVPPIADVPVSFWRLGKAHLVMPINKGDQGTLIFSQRSIDKWIVEGGQNDPEDSRKFAFSDAVFYPGLHSDTNPLVRLGLDDSVELTNEVNFIELLKSGKIKIGNDKRELLAHLKAGVEIIRDGLTITALGPSPWDAGTLTAINTWLVELGDLVD